MDLTKLHEELIESLTKVTSTNNVNTVSKEQRSFLHKIMLETTFIQLKLNTTEKDTLEKIHAIGEYTNGEKEVLNMIRDKWISYVELINK